MNDQVALTEEQLRSGSYKYVDVDVLERIEARYRARIIEEDNEILKLAIIVRYLFLFIGVVLVIFEIPWFIAMPWFFPTVLATITMIFFPKRAAKFKNVDA